MRVERLVISNEETILPLEFHPRLTVVAGLGRLERDGFCGEFLGALGSARPGVHLEVVDDDGRHLAVFRPPGRRHRVIDTDRAVDVSDEFRTAADVVDLLAKLGLSRRQARERMRICSHQLLTAGSDDDLVERLASVNQKDLWERADQLRDAEDLLSLEADAVGSSPEDAGVIEEIERRHSLLEARVRGLDRLRLLALTVGTGGAIGGLLTTRLIGSIGFAFIGIALISIVAAIRGRIRVNKAEASLQDALTEAGASSYLGFHLGRVNGLLDNDAHRHRLMTAADRHRRAQKAWQDLVGDIDVAFTVANRDRITALARVRRTVGDITVLNEETQASEAQSADVTRALIDLLQDGQKDGARVPVLLEEPLDAVDPQIKPAVLELLLNLSDGPQVILLTGDEDIASWARLEAMTGQLGLIEPTAAIERSEVSEHALAS